VDGDDSVFSRNVVTGGAFGAGIHVDGSRTRVNANRVSGIGSTGILVAGGSANVIDGNEIWDSRLVDGPPSTGDGIFVDAPAAGTLLRDNYVHDNEGDGIEVESADTRLRGNRAELNDDLGIDAVAGVTDLGGNLASRNGNPLGCVNVFCQ
jgi:parallel beta-helix repeat protein